MHDRRKVEIQQIRSYKTFIRILTGMLNCTSISSVPEDYDKLRNRISVQDFDLHASHSGLSRIIPIAEEMLSLDQRILWMERLTHMAEVNNLHVKSLAKKLEEKREANRELKDQIEMLMKENKELNDRNNELLDENKSLREIIQNVKDECTVDINNSMIGKAECTVDITNSRNKHGTRKLCRLKSQLLNACSCIRGEKTEHKVSERVHHSTL